MSYLFINNQEIKNDSGNPISTEVALDGSLVSSINPFPVTLGSESITITGNVNVGTSVEISNDVGNPIPIDGIVALDSDTLIALEDISATVSGVVALDSDTLVALENINATISGVVQVTDIVAPVTVANVLSPIAITDNDSSITIDGTVSINNFPSTQTIDGTVSVSNFPATQTVSLDSSSRDALENVSVTGSVQVTDIVNPVTVNGTVSVTQPVAITDNDSSITVDGTISVDNFPSTQTISGSVSVDNFPATQTVSLDSSSRDALENITATVTFPSVQTISGTVALDSNTLASLENVSVTGSVQVTDIVNPVTVNGTVSVTQPIAITDNDSSITIDGAVAVNNFPATQTVNGTVSVDNFPATQTVSLDSSSRDALENITATVTFPATQTVDGTVALDSNTLASLENITVSVTQPVAITDNDSSITVDGTVSVSNFPATQTVSLDSSSRDALENVGVTGTVSVDNFPATQTVDGTVALDSNTLASLENITASVTGSVQVTDIVNPVTVNGTVSVTQPVAITDNDSSITVDGTVSVSNFPATQTVDGTVSVSNFPATQTVSLDSSSRDALENITATVTFPSVQTVSLDSSSRDALENVSVTGTVSVDNFPATQAISGTIGLDSASLAALESVTADVSFEGNPVSLGNPLPVSGSMSVSSLPEIEIKNDSGNPISISRNTTQNSQTNPIFVKGTQDTTFFDPTQLDAFGRLRVSNPHTLFDNSFRYSDQTEKWNTRLDGSATATHNQNEGLMDLSTGGTAGDAVLRETKKVFQYQPGKSLLVMNTFVMESATHITQRVGYYGKYNGIYLEHDGTDTYIVKRSSVSGPVVDTLVPQSSWNGDPLDGTGSSGLTLDITKAQILWTDIEWLGVGSVRVGFVIDGKFILAHTFHHANLIESTYMTTATLPIRYEIVQTGAGVATTLKQICSTVISEGGYSAISQTRSASTALTGKNISNTSFTPLVSIRLKSNRTDSVVIPDNAVLYGLQAAAFKYAIFKEADLVSPSWASDSYSPVEFDLSATSMSGGTKVKEGIFVGDNKGGAVTIDLEKISTTLQLTRDIIDSDSAGDVLTLAVQSTTNNDDAVGSITWQEHS